MEDNKDSQKFLVLIVALFVVLLVVGGMYFVSKRRAPGEETPAVKGDIEVKKVVQISITKDGFIPETVTIEVSTLVVFVNEDSEMHRVASDPYPTNDGLSGFDSQEGIPPEGTYSFLFREKGTWTYHDDLNPYKLTGTVVVE